MLLRRLNVTANHIISEDAVEKQQQSVQLDLFTDYEQIAQEEQQKKAELAKERKVQEALLAIKHKYGKNAILKGTSYAEGATARERNKQIGGHKA